MTTNITKEFERKFLVRELPQNLADYQVTTIIQGYLAICENGTEVRIRKKGDRYYQTIKSGFGLEREEVEIEINRQQFEILWAMTKGKRVEKKRYKIQYFHSIIELDIYSGILDGLVVAEIEFASLKQAVSFIPPSWFGQEVTEDERYKNRNLVQYGIPKSLDEDLK